MERLFISWNLRLGSGNSMTVDRWPLTDGPMGDDRLYEKGLVERLSVDGGPHFSDFELKSTNHPT